MNQAVLRNQRKNNLHHAILAVFNAYSMECKSQNLSIPNRMFLKTNTKHQYQIWNIIIKFNIEYVVICMPIVFKWIDSFIHFFLIFIPSTHRTIILLAIDPCFCFAIYFYIHFCMISKCNFEWFFEHCQGA